MDQRTALFSTEYMPSSDSVAIISDEKGHVHSLSAMQEVKVIL
jgi:hypothetical protein